MDEQEIGGISVAHSNQSEHGGYSTSASATPSLHDDSERDRKKFKKLIQIVEPLQGTLRFSERIGEPSEAPQKFGDHMIVRNAREMFENIDILPDGRYFCRVCNRTYKTHATLTAHLRGSHLRQETKCQENGCNHVSYTESERKKHQKIHEKRRSKDYERITQSMDFPSRLSFPSEQALREQILRNNKDIPGMSKTMDEVKPGKVKYTCNECSQTFNSSILATKHSDAHQQSPQMCYYCGEVRKGPMDLQVHYMRSHKADGTVAAVCCTCNRGFTSTALFENHANQDECEVGCRNLEMRKEVYYGGELPAGVTIDQPTQNRLNFFRRRHEALEQLIDPPKEDKLDPIFAGSNSMIMTEFGLKKLDDYRKSAQFKSRPAKRSVSEDEERLEKAVKKERVLMAQNGYYEQHSHQHHHQASQSQQQQNIPVSSIPVFQPSMSYDPFVGKYPDLQMPHPRQYNHTVPHFSSPESMTTHSYSSYDSMDAMGGFMNPLNNSSTTNSGDFGMEDYSVTDATLANASEMASELLNNDVFNDPIYEELDKLQFAMPNSDENDRDEDLTDLLNIF